MQIRFFLSLLLLCVIFQYGSLSAGETQSAPLKTDALPTVETVRRVRLPLVHRTAPNALFPDTGDRIGRIFLDRKNHRLLVQVRRYKKADDYAQSLFWVEKGKARPCVEWPYAPPVNYPGDPELIAADIESGFLYYASSSGIGNGAYLHRIDREGDYTTFGENPGHLICLAPTRQKGRAYWGLNDWYTDVAEGGWVGEFQDGELLKRYNVRDTPLNLLYIAATNTALLIRADGWQPLNGKAHAYPQVTSGSERYKPPANYGNDLRLYAAALDADTRGQFLYYADRYGCLLYKIRLEDGAVAMVRRLPFLASTLVVDSDSGVIHLIDEQANSLVTVKLF